MAHILFRLVEGQESACYLQHWSVEAATDQDVADPASIVSGTIHFPDERVARVEGVPGVARVYCFPGVPVGNTGAVR